MREFTSLVSNHLLHLVQTLPSTFRWPLTSQELLSQCMSAVPHNQATLGRLRLPDLPRFERALEEIAASHDEFDISLKRDDTGLAIMDIARAQGHPGKPTTLSKKRKRNDEDDSAEEHEEENAKPLSSTRPFGISSFSKELQEAYIVLQQPTGKGRLLAEKVSSLPCHYNPS